MLKLFTFATSPYARKIQIVLDYKGVPYESCERCYSLDRKEDLREASKRAEVPVLQVSDGRSRIRRSSPNTSSRFTPIRRSIRKTRLSARGRG